MNRTTKLILDILMGAVIPILVLNNLTRPLGAPMAYLVAALVPVGWVFFDLLFLTRKFNFITSYVGFSAIVSGILAFWFVDGLLYAIKDTVGLALRGLIFGISVLLARPILKYFFIQALNPDTSDREQALHELLGEPDVRTSTMVATLIVVAESGVSSVVNFLLNLNIVTAPFGTEGFNQQVAHVNAITRIALLIPSFIVFGLAMWIVYRAIFRHLPSEEGKSQLESDFWELMRLREASKSQ